MTRKLSEGSLMRIIKGETVENPIFQILGHKKLSGEKSDRYRLLISDGKYQNSYAMLATQLNSRITNGEFTDHCIVEVTRYITSLVKNFGNTERRVIIILEMKLIQSGAEVGEKIGDPVLFSELDLKDDENNQQETATSAASTSTSSVQRQQKQTTMARQQPTSSPGNQGNIMPISSLNPYQNRWTIKVRVTNKGQIRTWSNARGDGKLFSMDLLDESGEIRFTAFNEQCDQFYALIELGKVYFIKNCNVKPANKQFNHLNCAFELSCNRETEIIPSQEEDGLPMQVFSFIPIDKVTTQDVNSQIDVIGICKEAHPVQVVLTKTTKRELSKRDLTIVDKTNCGITLTLWGTQASDFNCDDHPVIAIKNARVNEFMNTKSISVMNSSTFLINPDIDEAHKLRGWFDNIGTHENFVNLSSSGENSNSSNSPPNWLTFKAVREQQLGRGEKPDYFTTLATVTLIRTETMVYQACPTCRKKVLDNNNGTFRCENCQVEELPSFDYRMILNVNLGDHSGSHWVTCFQESGEQLMGVSSQILGELQNNKEMNQIDAKANAANFKTCIFRLRAKMEKFKDENRLRLNCAEIKDINFSQYNKFLLNDIKKMLSITT